MYSGGSRRRRRPSGTDVGDPLGVQAPPLPFRPANEAAGEDILAIFGTHGGDGSAFRCQCQRYKAIPRRLDYADALRPLGERAARLREQTQCGNPAAASTSGIVAYWDGEPVGWCAVERRSHHTNLGRVPWSGRSENKCDEGIWAPTCFVVRSGFRRRGVSYALARAAVDFAWKRGARVLEGYP